MRVLLLLSLLACAVLPTSLAQSSLPYSLQQIGSTTISGVTTPMIVRDERFTVNGANNAVTPSSTATSTLNKINHFIIVMMNQESFDAVMGSYPKGNTLANNANPAYNAQVSQPNFAGTTANPSLTSTSAMSSIPADANGQLPSAQPNSPLLYNTFFPTSTKVSQDPPHGYQQVIYKIDGGKMDGFAWSSQTSGALAMGHWDLTGSYLYQLAANYTLFDNFFGSAFGGPLLGHFYIIGGRAVQWDNGNSSPPLVLSDNATLAYHNYSTTTGTLWDIGQEGICTFPDNYVINNIHSPAFCGGPFMPLINDATVTGQPANLPDQLIAAGVSWGYYAEDWTTELSQAANSTCKTAGYDAKMSANMLPLTHYARYNNPTPGNSPDSSHLQDLDSAFFQKLQAGQLESVAWVQPDKRYDWGGGDVAPAPCDAWLNSTITAIFNSPHWAAQDTMVLITWENANGFYDHVPPYAGDRFGPGLRVATIAVSPYHTGGVVNSKPYEHLSLIKMIQTRYGLSQKGSTGYNPLMGQARDMAARDFTNTFDEAGAGKGSSSGASSVVMSVGMGWVAAMMLIAVQLMM